MNSNINNIVNKYLFVKNMNEIKVNLILFFI